MILEQQQGWSWLRLGAEVLLLIVGINVALWFEARFEDAREADQEQQYLVGLREDLRSDLEQLEFTIEWNIDKRDRLMALLPRLDTLGDLSPAEQGAAVWEVSGYSLFTQSDFTYTSMLQSGDFKLLSDAETKQLLLRLMRRYNSIDLLQRNFLQAIDDEYIPLLMAGVDVVKGRVVDPDMLRNRVFLNSFAFAAQDTGQRVEAMERARDQVVELIARLDAQIAESDSDSEAGQ